MVWSWSGHATTFSIVQTSQSALSCCSVHCNTCTPTSVSQLRPDAEPGRREECIFEKVPRLEHRIWPRPLPDILSPGCVTWTKWYNTKDIEDGVTAARYQGSLFSHAHALLPPPPSPPPGHGKKSNGTMSRSTTKGVKCLPGNILPGHAMPTSELPDSVQPFHASKQEWGAVKHVNSEEAHGDLVQHAIIRVISNGLPIPRRSGILLDRLTVATAGSFYPVRAEGSLVRQT